eukprot:6207157-Pleurochrysis_carterae.AAC.3
MPAGMLQACVNDCAPWLLTTYRRLKRSVCDWRGRLFYRCIHQKLILGCSSGGAPEFTEVCLHCSILCERIEHALPCRLLWLRSLRQAGERYNIPYTLTTKFSLIVFPYFVVNLFLAAESLQPRSMISKNLIMRLHTDVIAARGCSLSRPRVC